MNTQQNMGDRLWDFIDGTCSAEEKSFIEQLLQSNLEWRAKHKELLEVHRLMSNHIELDEPSMRFTQNVMEDIAKYKIAPAAKTYINKRVIWSIAAFFVLSIIGFLIYGFGTINWSDSSGTNLPFDFSKVDVSRMDFAKFFNNTYTTIFMMINVVLGLVMLDMYLGKKKKQLQSKNIH